MGENQTSHVRRELFKSLVMTVLLLASQFGTEQVMCQMTTSNCLIYHNNLCNINCATRPYNCYFVNNHYLCPCQVKCYEDHCMTGKIAQTCPGCAMVPEMCRPWHDDIELHTCGNKRMDTREAFRNHCQSWANCVNSCPPPGICYDDNARPNYGNYDILSDVKKVNEVLGTGK